MTNCSAHNNVGYGISANSVINCLAFNNSGDGISSNFSWGSVINCSIYGNKGSGIDYADSVINCSIRSNGLNGVSRVNRILNSAVFDNNGFGAALTLSGAVLSGCNIHNNLAGGVEIFPDYEYPGPATASLEQTTIHDNLFGILISCVSGASGGTGRGVTISSCSITHNLQNGICTEESGGSEHIDLSLRVLNTTVDSNGGFGISLNTTVTVEVGPSQYTNRTVYFPIDEVSGCAISNNAVGALGSFGSVNGCNITNNSEIGLDVFSLSGGINGNNIYDNGIYSINNHLSFGQDLNATMNWWGATNTTEIEPSYMTTTRTTIFHASSLNQS